MTRTLNLTTFYDTIILIITIILPKFLPSLIKENS